MLMQPDGLARYGRAYPVCQPHPLQLRGHPWGNSYIVPKHLLTGGAFRSALFSELVAPVTRPPILTAGSRVGVWCIERLLGRGGMSEVYLAQRNAEDFTQWVAIKVIAADLDAADLLRAERRHLGQLRHPGLATLIDGGELATGEVWLAMEYVEGEPIDEHVDRHRLDGATRILLIEQVGQAVGHAHRHLLVHRDIKPSNVLVDSVGHARLIDFGIAVAVAEATGERHRSWLTPGYAAPEQLRGDPPTTATDIYQLGQLLRTLLADDALPQPLPRAQRADLQRVIQCATHADPTARYASAAALCADLQALRSLRPLPGQARRAWQGLQLWRLRHRWVPWAALPLALAVLLSMVSALRSAWREAEERHLALREEQVSTAIGTFFIDLFNEPVSTDDARGTEGVAALLERGQQRLRERPNPVPEVQAALLAQLAQTHVQMERRDVAASLLEDAIRLQDEAGLSAPMANSLATLARLRVLAGDATAGHQLAAQASQQLALDLRPTRDRFLALTRLGEYHVHSFGFAAAEHALRDALNVGTQRYGADSPELFRTQRLLLEVLRNQWLIDAALPLSQTLTTACQHQFGADDSRCVTEFIHWQRLRAQGGAPAQAQTELEGLWDTRSRWDGQLRHYREHAVLFGLSDVYALQGDYFRALDSVLASLCPLQRAEGRGGPHWTSDRGGMALLLMDLGAAELALRTSTEARALYADADSLEGTFWAMRHARVAFAATGTVPADIEAKLRAGITRFREVYGDTSYFTARGELALAQIEAALGHTEAARTLTDRAARARPQGLHYYHPQLLAEIDTLRAQLSADPAERVRLLTRAEHTLRGPHGPHHVEVAAALLRRVHAEMQAGMRPDLHAAVEALQSLTLQQVDDSPQLQHARTWLAAAGAHLPEQTATREIPSLDPPCP